MTDLTGLLSIAERAVDLARDRMTTQLPADVHNKTDRDTVTDVDLRIEREVRAFLAAQTPDIGFLGEEEGRRGPDTDSFWTLDPVDGTANFVHGIPLSAISLALVAHGEPIVAVIDTPFLNKRYTATSGGGSYANGHQIHASTTNTLSQAIVSIGDYAVGPDAATKNTQRFRLTELLAERVERIRMFGSAAIDLAWVAEGRTDATIMLSNKPWDTAAGVLIAVEAGAFVLDAHGDRHTNASTETVAVGPSIAASLIDVLKMAERSQ